MPQILYAFCDFNPLVPQVFLLIAQASFINILSFDVQGEELPLPLPFHGSGEKIQFITYDRKHDFLYWSQTYPPAIMRSKIDGSQREVIISESIAIPVGVAINEDGSTLYWADVGLDKIEVVSVDSSGSGHKRRVIVDTGIDHPQGIALNEELGYVFPFYFPSPPLSLSLSLSLSLLSFLEGLILIRRLALSQFGLILQQTKAFGSNFVLNRKASIHTHIYILCINLVHFVSSDYYFVEPIANSTNQ